MKRARRGQIQKPKFSQPLAASALELISRALLKADAIAAPQRLFSAHEDAT
jgi:hypothetical protein